MSTVKETIGQQHLLDEMRSLAKHMPQVTILGKEFLIYPEVFHPGTTVDLKDFLTKEVLKAVEEGLMKKSEDATTFDFLEIGCGAGYTAILAALASQKCKVWATDINDIAVKNTIENAKLHRVDDRLTALTADVFDHEEFTGKEFDVIYWDFPWFSPLTEPGTQLDMLMRSIVDPGFEAFRRFLSQARSFLKKTGRIFVVFSFILGPKELFETVVNETGWRYKICCTDTFYSKVADKHNEVQISVVELLKQE